MERREVHGERGVGRAAAVPMTETPELPDAGGHFGPYGGRFVPETLIHALDQLAEEYARARSDPAFQSELDRALRDWVTRVRDTHYVLGSVLGPHPFPTLVRDFHRVIGIEARRQFAAEPGGLPDVLVACVGGGSNAIGLFHAFLDEPRVRKVGVEAGGLGIDSGKHAARLPEHSVGVLHGTRTLVLQDERGIIRETHSVSAGPHYPALGPEHAWLADRGLAEYSHATDDEALEAFEKLARLEGILPALESAHALAWLLREGKALGRH